MFRLLRDVWPKDGAAISPVTVEIYSRVLADIPDDLLQAATVQVLAAATFWPKPAELRKAAIGLRWPDELTGAEAWGRVHAYILKWPAGGRFVGDHHVDPPALPERIQRAVNAVGGLAYLRTSENAVADRARFCDVYDVLVRRATEHAQMLPEVRAVVERLQAPASAQLEAGG
jgi:hypothetical protein